MLGLVPLSQVALSQSFDGVYCPKVHLLNVKKCRSKFITYGIRQGGQLSQFTYFKNILTLQHNINHWQWKKAT